MTIVGYHNGPERGSGGSSPKQIAYKVPQPIVLSPGDAPLEPIAYVNGSFVPLSEAKVSVLDRGFLFADGIYEVAAVLDGKLIDNASHLARLERSVGEIELALPETTDPHPGNPEGAGGAQQTRQRHGLPGSDARRRHRA